MTDRPTPLLELAAEEAQVATTTAYALPSPAEIEAVQAAGESTLFRDGMRRETRRAYASALRYWDAWHRACYGTALPLFQPPVPDPEDGTLRPPPVPPDVIRNFVVHHAPRRVGDEITTWMPEAVRRRLRDAGVLGQRRVARTRPAADQDKPAETPDGYRIDPDLPSHATVRQRVNILCGAHRKLGMPSPASLDPRISQLLAAARTAAADLVPDALTKKKSPLLASHIERMVAACPPAPAGLRDRALIQVAFASGGRRRSEAVSLNFEHLQPFADPRTGLNGYLWSLGRTKTAERKDARTAALTAVIAGEAAEALDDWLDVLRAHGIESGAVFRRVRESPRDGSIRIGRRLSDRDYVRDVLVARAHQAFPDEAEDLDIAGHSIRHGFITEGKKQGMTSSDLMAMTGHEDVRTFEDYYQVDAPLDEAARVLQALHKRSDGAGSKVGGEAKGARETPSKHDLEAGERPPE